MAPEHCTGGRVGRDGAQHGGAPSRRRDEHGGRERATHVIATVAAASRTGMPWCEASCIWREFWTTAPAEPDA